MKSFIKDEWTFNYHDRNLDLFSLPTEQIFKDETFYVYLCHIAHSPGVTRQVYFVDINERRAWVTKYQCKNKNEALEKLNKMRSVYGK